MIDFKQSTYTVMSLLASQLRGSLLLGREHTSGAGWPMSTDAIGSYHLLWGEL